MSLMVSCSQSVPADLGLLQESSKPLLESTVDVELGSIESNLDDNPSHTKYYNIDYDVVSFGYKMIIRIIIIYSKL